jgi:hypothetical protein
MWVRGGNGNPRQAHSRPVSFCMSQPVNVHAYAVAIGIENEAAYEVLLLRREELVLGCIPKKNQPPTDCWIAVKQLG